jgi:hypothetical protein
MLDDGQRPWILNKMPDTKTAVHPVLELLREEELRFPDVDADILDALTERTRARAADVEVARAALDEARAALDRELTELARLAERAAAYLEVYAKGDEELAARVASLAGPAKAAGAAPTKQRRARSRNKQNAEDTARIERGPNGTPPELPFVELPFVEQAFAEQPEPPH